MPETTPSEAMHFIATEQQTPDEGQQVLVWMPACESYVVAYYRDSEVFGREWLVGDRRFDWKAGTLWATLKPPALASAPAPVAPVVSAEAGEQKAMHVIGTSPRDWTEDFAHENGRYLCGCCKCGQNFFGHKRRVVCRVCDSNSAAMRKALEEIIAAERAIGYERCPDCDTPDQCSHKSGCYTIEVTLGGTMIQQVARAALAAQPVPPPADAEVLADIRAICNRIDHAMIANAGAGVLGLVDELRARIAAAATDSPDARQGGKDQNEDNC